MGRWQLSSSKFLVPWQVPPSSYSQKLDAISWVIHVLCRQTSLGRYNHLRLKPTLWLNLELQFSSSFNQLFQMFIVALSPVPLYSCKLKCLLWTLSHLHQFYLNYAPVSHVPLLHSAVAAHYKPSASNASISLSTVNFWSPLLQHHQTSFEIHWKPLTEYSAHEWWSGRWAGPKSQCWSSMRPFLNCSLWPSVLLH